MTSRSRAVELLHRTWSGPTNPFARVFMPVNNKIVGVRFMVTAFIFFVIGGVLALLMRTQLAVPENDFLDPELYNQLFTMHGSTMMFLFVVPFIEGLGIYFVPAMIGARDMAYPRLTAFGYWIYLFGGLLFYSSFFVGQVPDTGWFAYTPLSGKEFSPGIAQDFWLIGLSLTELSGIGAGAELVVTALKLRAPGMSITRMPIFVWSMLVTGFAMTFAFTVLFVATLLLELERTFGMTFFNPESGGSPILWQHLFWIFGHPEVYIMFIPATGIVSTIVPTFARRPLALYRLVILALLVTGFVSFGLWVHHMFTTGLPELAASFFTATSFMIALATGTQIFAWIATLWGTRPRLTVPMLYVLGFVVIFMLGGVTGVMIASVPFDWQAHDSFFIVAHFHYVLVGGVVLPLLGAIHYWMPKISGRMMNETLGKIAFWIVFVSFNVAFFPMHIMGLLAMPRRIYTYQEGTGLDGYNLLSTIGSYALGVGVLLFVIDVVLSLRFGAPAGRNPWQAGTLEWAGSSPPPSFSVETPLIVRHREPLWIDGWTGGTIDGRTDGRTDWRADGQDVEWSEGPQEGQGRREPDEEQLVNAARALDAGPEGWRAGLVTSSFGGEPRGVHFYPGPTLQPFIAALGVSLVALALLLKIGWLGIAGLVIAAVTFGMWLWPTANERDFVWRSNRLLDPNGKDPSPGGAEVGAFGAAMFCVVVSTILVVLLFSYLYLVGPAGPPQAPSWLLPAVAASGLVIGAILTALAVGRLRRGDSGLFVPFLSLSLLLGLAFLAVQGYSLLQLDFSPTLNAYASAFYTVNGFVLLIVTIGVALLVAALLRHVRGLLEGALPTPLLNAALYWYTVVALAVLSFVVLYLVPLL
ncbi:MAG: cytochrome c oxidase subunit I [Trueperaceae bacterium]